MLNSSTAVTAAVSWLYTGGRVYRGHTSSRNATMDGTRFSRRLIAIAPVLDESWQQRIVCCFVRLWARPARDRFLFVFIFFFFCVHFFLYRAWCFGLGGEKMFSRCVFLSQPAFGLVVCYLYHIRSRVLCIRPGDKLFARVQQSSRVMCKSSVLVSVVLPHATERARRRRRRHVSVAVARTTP